MLSKLEFVNFRNLETASIEFSPKLNIFYGNNAQGKTNLLEAIYLLSTGKSFRAETDRELINWNEEASKLVGEAPPLGIEIQITKQTKKLLVNRQPKRLVDLVGEFVVVLFAPEDLQLVSGSPSLRRAWLNALISKIDRVYLENLIKFNQVLKNRNRLLLALKQGSGADLEPWTDQLVKLEVNIWNQRELKVLAINETLKKVAPKLGISKIFIDYETQLGKTKPSEEFLKKEYARLRSEEISRAQTLLGPHRDDFKIIFEEIKERKLLSKDIGVYGSRGEQRTGVLGLKLAELELIEEVKGKRPSLLLDDVLSEFDEQHREMIQNLLSSQQSFITTTSLDFLTEKIVDRAKKFLVKEGNLAIDPKDGKGPSVSSEE